VVVVAAGYFLAMVQGPEAREAAVRAAGATDQPIQAAAAEPDETILQQVAVALEL
jgi:hypothetical protein